MTVLRDDVLAGLLVQRLDALGPVAEGEALDALDARAPGRGAEVVRWALHVGLVRRVPHADGPPTLEAVPRALATRA